MRQESKRKVGELNNMERYYIAEKNSSLRKDYLEWKKNERELVPFIKSLLKNHGVETEQFSAGETFLSIKATENDLLNFSGKFLKDSHEGYFTFKKSTPIMKEWIAKESGYKTLHKPPVPWYFKNCYGKIRTRLFDINGTVYCSIECDSDFQPCDNLTEIKGNEFFKAIEYEKQRTGKEN